MLIYLFGFFFRERKMLVFNELSIRKKSLSADNFPNQELLDEFLVRKETVPSKLDLQWKKPKIARFVVSNKPDKN